MSFYCVKSTNNKKVCRGPHRRVNDTSGLTNQFEVTNLPAGLHKINDWLIDITGLESVRGYNQCPPSLEHF